MRSAKGSGTQRLYSFRDIVVLKIVKRLLDTGVSLQQIRSAVHALQECQPLRAGHRRQRASSVAADGAAAALFAAF